MNNNLIFTALQLAGYGMLGVFIFMSLFYLVIYFLEKSYPYVPDKKEEESGNGQVS